MSNLIESTLRDCTCRTHDGPHWLHLDYFDYRMNLNLLERAVQMAESGNGTDAYFLLMAFCEREATRLKDKAYQMEHAHIERISYQALGAAMTEDVQAREKALLARLRVRVQKSV